MVKMCVTELAGAWVASPLCVAVMEQEPALTAVIVHVETVHMAVVVDVNVTGSEELAVGVTVCALSPTDI